MDLVTLILFLVGGVLLIGGAQWLIDGAAGLAEILGVPPLIVGLTVVSLGTSAPEIAVSVQAALSGQADITVGNVVGSNIANVMLVLGLSAVVVPLAVAPQLLRLDVPVMITAALVMTVMAADGVVSRSEGLLLAMGLVAYLSHTVRDNLRAGGGEPASPTPAATLTPAVNPTTAEVTNAPPATTTTEKPDDTAADAVNKGTPAMSQAPKPSPTAREVAILIGMIPAGLVALVVGSGWLVDGVVALAMAMGVSELVVGLTIVAVGTSLPELVTTVMACARGQSDIAVGNVVGSNILNILCVLGLTAIVAPEGVPVAAAARNFDIPVMLAATVVCLPIFYVGGDVTRWEGALLLGYYVVYALYLVLQSSHHYALPVLSTTMLLFVMPASWALVAGWSIQAVMATRRKSPSTTAAAAVNPVVATGQRSEMAAPQPRDLSPRDPS